MKKCLLPSNRDTPPRKPYDHIQDMQERNDITSWALHPEQMARGLKSMYTSTS